eukprot:COSAG01_NODE_14792_length_1409_cov_1.330534_1_plen_103_part_10
MSDGALAFWVHSQPQAVAQLAELGSGGVGGDSAAREWMGMFLSYKGVVGVLANSMVGVLVNSGGDALQPQHVLVASSAGLCLAYTGAGFALANESFRGLAAAQ